MDKRAYGSPFHLFICQIKRNVYVAKLGISWQTSLTVDDDLYRQRRILYEETIAQQTALPCITPRPLVCKVQETKKMVLLS